MKCKQCGTVYQGELCPGCGYDPKNENSVEQSISKQTSDPKPKKSFYKRWWFWLIIIIIFISVAIGGSNSNDNSKNDGKASVSQTQSVEDKSVKVQEIADFSQTEYKIETDKTIELSTYLSPKGITNKSIKINSSNSEVITICDVFLSDDDNRTLLKFSCKALAEGTAIVTVSSDDGTIKSNEVKFEVTTAPKIESISQFSKSYESFEVGDGQTYTCYLTPVGLTEDDIVISNTEPGVIKISDVSVSISDEGDRSVLTFKVTAVSAGTSKVSVKSEDGKTESNEISVTVKEKSTSKTTSGTKSSQKSTNKTVDKTQNSESDTSRTVYVTPHGEKYHFLSSCGGKNSRATTLDRAKASGKSPCSKCAH